VFRWGAGKKKNFAHRAVARSSVPHFRLEKGGEIGITRKWGGWGKERENPSGFWRGCPVRHRGREGANRNELMSERQLAEKKELGKEMGCPGALLRRGNGGGG